ncbi:MAG: tetratricopeptide repeat protein [Nitrospirae bacterium]|nr:tetratricopeptide repeat protein [Nitrospirota bacterium]MBI3351517.1 tetratricopeptide repeat protein [Nitrospirota bacterium]
MKEKIPGNEEIELGKAYLKEKNYPEALKYFKKAFSFYQDNPNQTPGVLLSSYGYARAIGEKNVSEGIAFCKKGLMRKDQAPEHYLYLAELYLMSRRKREAYKTIETGLKMFKNHSRLSETLREFGVRKKPIVSLLDRSHPVNKVIGKIVREPVGKRK